jgi:hypothetical protein
VHGRLHQAFTRADLPLQPAPLRPELERRSRQSGMDAWVAKKMMAILDEGGKLPTTYKAPFVLWQLGPDLTMVCLPGEVVVGYVPLLERALGPNNLWLAAYCNDVFGYLPTARLLREGGYETRGLYAGGIGVFAPNAQDVVVDTVRLLAEKVGRHPPPPRPAR